MLRWLTIEKPGGARGVRWVKIRSKLLQAGKDAGRTFPGPVPLGDESWEQLALHELRRDESDLLSKQWGGRCTDGQRILRVFLY